MVEVSQNLFGVWVDIHGILFWSKIPDSFEATVALIFGQVGNLMEIKNQIHTPKTEVHAKGADEKKSETDSKGGKNYDESQNHERQFLVN